MRLKLTARSPPPCCSPPSSSPSAGPRPAPAAAARAGRILRDRPADAAHRQGRRIHEGGRDRDRADGVPWSSVQPKRRRASTTGPALDEGVGIAARAGLKVLPFLYGTPHWLAAKPTTLPIDNARQRAGLEGIPHRRGRTLRPAAANSGSEHAPSGGVGPRLRTARVPKLPIRTWQIWNEANFFYFAIPASPSRYAKLVTLSSQAIKAADPGAKVILSGLFAKPTATAPEGCRPPSSSKPSTGYPGIKTRFDGISLHPYAVDTETLEEYVEEFHDVTTENHDRVPPLHHRDGLGLAARLPAGRLRAGAAGPGPPAARRLHATCSKTATASTSNRSTGSPGRTSRATATSATRSASSAKARVQAEALVEGLRRDQPRPASAARADAGRRLGEQRSDPARVVPRVVVVDQAPAGSLGDSPPLLRTGAEGSVQAPRERADVAVLAEPAGLPVGDQLGQPEDARSRAPVFPRPSPPAPCAASTRCRRRRRHVGEPEPCLHVGGHRDDLDPPAAAPVAARLLERKRVVVLAGADERPARPSGGGRRPARTPGPAAPAPCAVRPCPGRARPRRRRGSRPPRASRLSTLARSASIGSRSSP